MVPFDMHFDMEIGVCVFVCVADNAGVGVVEKIHLYPSLVSTLVTV